MEDAAIMTEADIRRIVSETVEQTVEQTLTKLGIDPDQPIEFQKDMAFVRSWRTSSDTAKRQSILAAVGILTTGILGLVWMAIKGH